MRIGIRYQITRGRRCHCGTRCQATITSKSRTPALKSSCRSSHSTTFVCGLTPHIVRRYCTIPLTLKSTSRNSLILSHKMEKWIVILRTVSSPNRKFCNPWCHPSQNSPRSSLVRVILPVHSTDLTQHGGNDTLCTSVWTRLVSHQISEPFTIVRNRRRRCWLCFMSTWCPGAIKGQNCWHVKKNRDRSQGTRLLRLRRLSGPQQVEAPTSRKILFSSKRVSERGTSNCVVVNTRLLQGWLVVVLVVVWSFDNNATETDTGGRLSKLRIAETVCLESIKLIPNIMTWKMKQGHLCQQLRTEAVAA
jgi:hypothetical protein